MVDDIGADNPLFAVVGPPPIGGISYSSNRCLVGSRRLAAHCSKEEVSAYVSDNILAMTTRILGDPIRKESCRRAICGLEAFGRVTMYRPNDILFKVVIPR